LGSTKFFTTSQRTKFFCTSNFSTLLFFFFHLYYDNVIDSLSWNRYGYGNVTCSIFPFIFFTNFSSNYFNLQQSQLYTESEYRILEESTTG
jgi:hypothetical protein